MGVSCNGGIVMIGTKDLEILLEDVLISGSLADERPVSLIMIAPPGMGKSDMVLQYRQSEGVVATTETTFFALMTMHGQAMQQGKLHHIIVPDLGPIINKPREGALRELSQFGALVAEGLINWRSARGAFAVGNQPVRCGIIFCITPYSYREKLAMLTDEGFLSRFLIASFALHDDLVSHIHDQISAGSVNAHLETKLLAQWKEKQSVSIAPRIDRFLRSSGIIEQVRDLSDTAGFRTHHHLRTLLKANALRRGRHEVGRDDIDDLIALSQYLGVQMRWVGQGVTPPTVVG